MKRIFYALAVALMALPLGAREKMSRADKIAAQIKNPDSKYVIVTAHRGDWRNFPENSLTGIESAIEMGVDIVEIDIHRTKDGVLVLQHDATIDRCTNGSGKISDMTYAEIRKYHLMKGHRAVADTARVPSLRMVLELCKDRVCINIDKGWNYYDEILALTEELGVTGQVLIKGSKPIDEVAAKMAAHEHNMMYMPVVNLNAKGTSKLLEDYLSRGVVPLAYEVCYNKGREPLEIAAPKILEQGARVWVNTLWPSLCGGFGYDDDSAFTAEKPGDVYGWYLDHGVTMIQTDRPELLVRYLKHKGRHNLR